jgi:hypothetical protein
MGIHRVANRALLSLALSVTAVAAAGCAQPVVVHTAKNPTASFDKYATFSFGPAEGPPRGYHTSTRSPEVQQRLEALISTALTQRGYTPSSGKGDFFVMFGAGRREVVAHDASDDVAGEWQPDDENADFVEGSLVVDAFDATTDGKVWHGASRAQVDPNHINEAELQRSVTALLASFPVRHAPSATSDTLAPPMSGTVQASK